MTVLILVNGDPPSAALAQRLAAQHDLLLAADGAAHRAAELGVLPDVICGDFDSVHIESVRAAFPNAEFVPTPDQDFADGEKALLVARARGATSITLMGATGGRLDHTLANFALLMRYHREIHLRIVDDRSQVRVVSGTDDMPGKETLAVSLGDTLSLISFEGAAHVTLEGVRWPLHDARLPIGTHGVSNVATADQVSIQVRSGAVFVCHLPEGPAEPEL